MNEGRGPQPHVEGVESSVLPALCIGLHDSHRQELAGASAESRAEHWATSPATRPRLQMADKRGPKRCQFDVKAERDPEAEPTGQPVRSPPMPEVVCYLAGRGLGRAGQDRAHRTAA
jgi:hypothetical protein